MKEFKKEFVALFLSVYSLYKRKPNDPDPSPEVYDIWYNSIREYGFEAVNNAFAKHIKNPDNGQFMPKPADIIRIIEGSNKDKAFAAWTTVEKAIGMVGGYESVIFDDPIIHRVIQDMGGWVRICQILEKDISFTSNEFKNRYNAFWSKREIPEYSSKLIGIIEGENRSAGYLDHIPEPKLIGEPEKAKEVLLLGSNKPSLRISTAGEGLKQIITKQPEGLN